jgi:hypothetical protein
MKKLTDENNNEIKYELRENRVLLLFTSFNDSKLSTFADLLDDGCTQIERVDKLIRYDDGTGAIVATMKIGYNEPEAHAEIQEVFDWYFTKHIHV